MLDTTWVDRECDDLDNYDLDFCPHVCKLCGDEFDHALRVVGGRYDRHLEECEVGGPDGRSAVCRDCIAEPPAVIAASLPADESDITF